MFAARLRDENAIHDQQTAAASKPLNAGVKGLAPKTPAKTPFKSNRNDENATQIGGKTGGKGGKLERSAFVTPASKSQTVMAVPTLANYCRPKDARTTRKQDNQREGSEDTSTRRTEQGWQRPSQQQAHITPTTPLQDQGPRNHRVCGRCARERSRRARD